MIDPIDFAFLVGMIANVALLFAGVGMIVETRRDHWRNLWSDRLDSLGL